MAENISGRPGTRTSITDLSVILANIVKGYICVQGITRRGEPNKLYPVSSWEEFKQYLGGLHPDDDFPLMCKHALDSGGKLIISRPYHQTDLDDIATIVGTAANEDIDNDAVVEVLASSVHTLSAFASGNTITARALVNGVMTIIGTYTGIGGDTPTLGAAGLRTAINALTGTTGYTATSSTPSITIKAPTGTGAQANNTPIEVTVTGATLSANPVKFTGGVTAYLAITSTWTAKGVGPGYNGSTITLTAQANNPDLVTITIQLNEAPTPQVITNVPRTQTATSLATLNKQMLGISVDNLNGSNQLPVGTCTLASGAETATDIDDDDYIGSSIAKTGWYAFDDVTGSMRIWNFNAPSHAVNKALALYCQSRTDVRGRGRLPQGLTIPGMNDFRDGTGAYAHIPIDTFYFDYWETDALANDPNNSEVSDYAVSGMGCQAAARTLADEKRGEWWSDSDEEFAKLQLLNGVRLNLGSPGNAGAWDILYEKGINAIVNDSALKICNMGNRTCLLDATKLTSKANIADMCVFIAREVKKIARKKNFKPNDITMFEQLYLAVLPFIKDTLVAGRAIEGDNSPEAGEGKWWHWMGDQFAKDLNDLKVNTKSDVDAGKYRVRFAFKPIASNEYIVIDIAPADSVTILNVQQLSNLNA